MFIDSHCHLDAYEEASGETIESLFKRLTDATSAADSPIPDLNGPRTWSSKKDSSPDPNVRMPEAFIHNACDPKDFSRGVELAEKYPFVYACFGIHPEYIETSTAEDETRLLTLLKHPKCVGCGEFGLDYHYGADYRDKQVKFFERHLEWGIDSGKPMVLHLREADDDALAVLKRVNLHGHKIHIHCFTGSPEFASKLLELDAQIFVGFTGIITFKSAQNVRDALSLVPLDQMLLETDTPYMAPVPHRGVPCHPGFIPYVAQMMSEVKKVPVEDIYRYCRENTRKCYGI